MKAFVVFAIIGAVAAAPANNQDKLLRAKKSAYGSPCAGAGALSPVSLYLSPAPQLGGLGGGLPHYRAEEHKEDGQEHTEQARSYYESSGAIASVGAGGPAIGLFPNAKLGGCAIPLLLSCSPSVVSGHIAHSASYGAPAAYGAPSHYRAPEEHHKEMKSEHASEKSWAMAERTGADHEEPHSGHVQLDQSNLAGNFLDHHEDHQHHF